MAGARSLALGMLAMLGLAGFASAQEVPGGIGGMNIYEQQLRVQMDQQAAENKEVGFDAGGWFNYALFNYDDNTNTNRTLNQFSLRAWAKLNVQGVHQVYVRALTGWDVWDGGNPKDEGENNVYYDPKLERAWYKFDLGKLMEQNGQKPPVRLSVQVGRDYLELGTGFGLSTTLDMVRINASMKNWDVLGFLGKTVYHSKNIIESDPVYERNDRCVWGGQMTFTGMANHRPFAYFVSQTDHTPTRYDTPDQKYRYNSRYVGLGSTGTIFSPNLMYGLEGVGEFGETFSDGSNSGRDRICAGGIDAMLQYLFQTQLHPHVGVEYMFGSGDRDRTLSATSISPGGNKQGTIDHAFNSMGYRDTGVAFAPRVSNLHIYSANAGFYPLESVKLFKRMEWGVKGFVYQKAVSGAISDDTGANDSRWVGWEVDVYCDWRITSDVTLSVRYGAFQPGSAFESGETRNFFYTGLTYSF